MSNRTDAANIAGKILYHLGELSALVPRGALLGMVDAEAERVMELADAIGSLPREQWRDYVAGD